MARVRDRLRAQGLAPSRARGQNFLRSPDDARRLVDAAGLEPGDAAVEIGPGLGDFTRAIASRARRVLALELDHGLIRALADAGLPANVEVRQGDALEVDVPALGLEVGAPALLLGNLPYSVAQRLIAGLLIEGRLFGSFRRLGFMVQSEVAQRMLAAPDTQEYGSLSVWCQLYSRPRRAVELGPGAFVPRPRVQSTFVVFDPPATLPALAARAPLQRLIQAAFRARRKMLRRALSDAIEQVPDPTGPLVDAGIDGRLRGETLRPEDFVRLANAFATHLNGVDTDS